MAFPDDPRDVLVGFAFGKSASADPTAAVYEQVSPNPNDPSDPGPVLGGVTITRGRIGDAPTTQPTQIDTALRNTGGEFSPRNVAGPRYGTLRKGTPMQVQVDAGSGPVTRARAAVPDWNPKWDGPRINDRLPIRALGTLNRLGRSRDARSALRRYCDPVIAARVGHAVPRSYWPIDHGESSAANQAAALLGSVRLRLEYAAGDATASWSAAELAPWLGRGLQVDGSMRLFGPAPADATVTEAAAADVLLRNNLPSDLPAAVALRLHEAATEGGDPYNYLLIGTNSALGGMNVFLYRENLADSTITPFGAGTTEQAELLWDGRLHHLRVMAVQSGSNVAVSAYIDGTLIISGAHTSATLDIPEWEMAMTGQPRAALGHAMLWAGDAADIPPASDLWEVVQGYPGESAADRITRLCLEDGVPIDIAAGPSPALGPQYPAALLDLLRECEAADHGILYELTDGRLAYKPLSSLYSQPVAMALDYGTRTAPGNCSAFPVDDDRDLYNIIKVRMRDGAEATAELDKGPVGTDESEGVGPRPAPPITLGLADDEQPPHHAAWILHETTTDKPRALVSIDLRATPEIIDDWLACDIGSRITVAQPPRDHFGPDPLDLILVGYTETLDATTWQALLYCEPYAPYAVGVLGTARTNTAGCVLAADLGEATATADVTNAGIEWSATATPYDIAIGGERMTVTAVSGTGASQTLTVTRSVNGVVKSHAAGAKVALFEPAHTALGR